MRTNTIVVAAAIRSASILIGRDPGPNWDSSGSDDVAVIGDEWGVPHLYGPTDTSVVFGAAYAQARGNWRQVEDNIENSLEAFEDDDHDGLDDDEEDDD